MTATTRALLASYADFTSARRALASGDVQLAEAMGNLATRRLYDLARRREVDGKIEPASALRDLGRSMEIAIPNLPIAEH